MNKKRILLILALVSVLLGVAATAWAQTSDATILGRPSRLTGTWLIDVSESDQGLPPFRALQTFHADGTFTETSSLLGGGEEGPAHGVWQRIDRDDYALTFYLFVFDENGDAAGMVRVRVAIHLIDSDHLTGDTAVDFIEPDGTVIPDVDSGPFTGERLLVEPVP